MRIIDLNLLIYAINADAPHHTHARAWLDQAISGYERLGLAWIVILGFLRITTNGRIIPRPLSTEQAIGVIDEWLAHPNTAIVSHTPDPGLYYDKDGCSDLLQRDNQ